MTIAQKYLPKYTYKDYCQWEGQWELIEGIPYAMSPLPTPIHQNVNANLHGNFKKALKKACGKCKVYIPIDWKIAENIILQPDLLIVCKPIEKKFLDFTPILVVEILSPSTALKDRNVKKQIYLSQGVKYFLILNPETKKNEVFELLNNEYVLKSTSPKTFTFILEDGCKTKVDFSDIWE
jgi:Uma2 family endonuclease